MEIRARGIGNYYGDMLVIDHEEKFYLALQDYDGVYGAIQIRPETAAMLIDDMKTGKRVDLDTPYGFGEIGELS